MIYLNGFKLNDYSLSTDEFPSSRKAGEIFEKYVSRICGKTTDDNAAVFVSIKKTFSEPDRFLVSLDKNCLIINGGQRGVLYAVFDFLERCGCRFFTPELKVFPENDVYLSDFYYEDDTKTVFREILGNTAGNSSEDFVMFRLNSKAWTSRYLTEEYGDGISYAGIAAHSLTGEFLLKPFTETHPEYFSLVDGKRLTDRMGQICFSSPEAVEAVIGEVKKLLRSNPNASFVSVSQGDNGNYCQCEKCREKYKHYNVAELFLSVVNEVAKAIKQEFPHVLVHTFAYTNSCDPPRKADYEDNIIIQYCFSNRCRNHLYEDANCPENVADLTKFEKWTGSFKNVLIWDYPNCFKYQMINRPDISKLRQDVAFYASKNVHGMFFEYVHRAGDNACVFAELKTYLISKLMWNPYMSEQEYDRHLNEFAAAYYGKGYTYILDYLDYYERSIDTDLHFNYDLSSYSDKTPCFDLIPKSKRKEFFEKSYDLFAKAIELANGEQRSRIERDRISLLYLDCLTNFDDIMESGSQKEKDIMLSKNRNLVDLICENRIKTTFWGQSIEMQIEEMPNYFTISPRKWNYKW